MNDTCIHRVINIVCVEYFIWFCIILLIVILKRRYGNIAVEHLEFIFYLLQIVWLIARLCNSLNLSCQMDIITIYFIVWQFQCVICKWIFHELPWFSFNIQQGLLCLCMSYFALQLNDICFRYLSIYFKIAFLWCYALEDW